MTGRGEPLTAQDITNALVSLGLPLSSDCGLTLSELFETMKAYDAAKWDHTSLVVWAVYNSQSRERIPVNAFHPYRAQPKPKVDTIRAFVERLKERDRQNGAEKPE